MYSKGIVCSLIIYPKKFNIMMFYKFFKLNLKVSKFKNQFLVKKKAILANKVFHHTCMFVSKYGQGAIFGSQFPNQIFLG